MKKYDLEKIQGMLLGLHVGDSLGATLEFDSPRGRDNLHTEIIGGGPFEWEPGQPTDDTLMMIMLLESLVENKGTFDVLDVATRYVQWMESEPDDIGTTIATALNNIKNGVDPLKSGLKDHYSQANGSLMRSAPLALFLTTEESISSQCSITHAHPNCVAADMVFIKALKELLLGESKESVYNNALENSRALSIELYDALKNVPQIKIEEVESSGYVISTLVYAFWGLMTTESFEEALIKVVNRGGDADTLGAVCGALCGASYGLKLIPKRWVETIQEKEKIIHLVAKINFNP